MNHLAALLSPGIQAVRRYWRPFVALQSAALLLVVAFYSSEHVRRACAELSEWKRATGLASAALATAFAGVVLPGLAKMLVLGERDRRPARQRLADHAYNLLIFALIGVIIDLQYRAFNAFIGSHPDARTITLKVLVDQFITTPIYGVPFFSVMFAWRAHRFRVLPLLRATDARWYARTVVPVLLPCWSFWIPMCALIYSLPGDLQFCLFTLAMAAWSLLLLFMTDKQTSPA